MSRIIILVGEPGCGKTEFGLNLLKNVDAKKKYLVDLDYINPYFRGREHTNYLIENNIELLGSNFKGQDNVDMPAISADTKIPFFTESCFAVYDLAGGINGVNALKLFEQEIIDNKDSIELLYVANLACSVGKTEFEIKQFISQINKNCAIKVSGIVNNTHLMSETTPEFICKNFEKLLAMNLNVDINYIQINENLKININLKNIKIIKMKKPLGQSTWLKEKDEG